MKTTVHKADSRGAFDHGWLQTVHTFSFDDYFNPQRVHFGALRVLNDDKIAPTSGFGMHMHRNMEIITIPLHGAIEHRDSIGNSALIEPGEVQVMSAGTGIRHSENNLSVNKSTELLQIWVLPNREEVAPRYETRSISELMVPNEIRTFVYPDGAAPDGTLWIYQLAWLSMGMLERGTELRYHLHTPDSYGVYLFVISGGIDLEGYSLDRRDGIGIGDVSDFEIHARHDSQVLLIEVPPVL